MFTIKKITKDNEFACGQKVELFESKGVTVIYHCDEEFSGLFGDSPTPIGVHAVLITDEQQIPVNSEFCCIYVVNENGKTVQTV